VRNLEPLAAVNKIGGWIEVLMKIFIKTSDICQESYLTKGPTNYILLVRDDRLDSSCITFHQNTFRQFIETPLFKGKPVSLGVVRCVGPLLVEYTR
jgi:hypothetical protein